MLMSDNWSKMALFSGMLKVLVLCFHRVWGLTKDKKRNKQTKRMLKGEQRMSFPDFDIVGTLVCLKLQNLSSASSR